MLVTVSGASAARARDPRPGYGASFPKCYGVQFAEQLRNHNTIYSRPMRLDMICQANGIEHRLTKPNHPWTNGQIERMLLGV